MRSIGVSLVLAGCLGLASWPAAAQGVRIAVGDLSTPQAVRGFDQRLDAAAQRFCGARYAITDLDGRTACLKAIREEALDKLTPDQRSAYGQAQQARIEQVAR
jgi:UrcA family protein